MVHANAGLIANAPVRSDAGLSARGRVDKPAADPVRSEAAREDLGSGREEARRLAAMGWRAGGRSAHIGRGRVPAATLEALGERPRVSGPRNRATPENIDGS